MPRQRFFLAVFQEYINQAGSLSFRAGMRGVVDARQLLEIEMGVDLRGANVGVTKQFLDRAQVA